MKDNKKQIIVVVALALVIVSVGVFQFVIGNKTPPPPRQATKAESKAPMVAAETSKPGEIKNKLIVMDLPARDPFQTEALPSAPDTQPTQKAVTTPDTKPDKQIKGTVLPPVGGGPVTLDGPIGGGKGLAIEPEKFAFTVSGVMLGEKPMAVFSDAQGNQRLIMLGGSLDPDSQVVSIDKDAVTVRFHGKTLRLTVEGNPNAK